jgi:putative flippase GtrA
MKTDTNIFLRYVVFCIAALVSNLLVQAIFHELFYSPDWLSIGSGTATALILKYILDRNYIFYANNQGLSGDLYRFFVYTLFGLFTTLLFWAVEWAFIKLFTHHLARYAGAFLGAGIGYVLKYFMDRRWVFKSQV